jgi:hypothetical protein
MEDDGETMNYLAFLVPLAEEPINPGPWALVAIIAIVIAFLLSMKDNINW